MLKLLKNFTLVAALLAMGTLTGCGDDVTNQNTFPAPAVNQLDLRYTMQGKIMDATTGQALGGNDLQLFLVQGVTNRTADKLIVDPASPLMGEYAFNNIPADTVNNNKTFKVVAVKSGYQRFEGEVTFTATATGGNLYDTSFNRVGNIYLFPVGAAAPSYTFTVTLNNKPVPNAKVLLQPRASTNVQTAPGTVVSSTIAATTGYLQTLEGTTDASGKVSFAGGDLVLGGSYLPVVQPVIFEGMQTARTVGTAVQVGLSNSSAVIAADYLANSGNPYGLFVTTASNTNPGSITGSGILTMTFSRPVILNGATGFTAVVYSDNFGSTAALNVAPNTVTASLSGDGLTLTLTPNFTTPFAADDFGGTVVYSNGTASVSVREAPGDSFQVFGDLLNAVSNANQSGEVQMIGPSP